MAKNPCLPGLEAGDDFVIPLEQELSALYEIFLKAAYNSDNKIINCHCLITHPQRGTFDD